MTRSRNNAFCWEGQSSSFATDPKFAHKNQGSAGMPAKDHPLRDGKKSLLSSRPLDRTQSINTERCKAKPVYSAE